MNKKRTLVIVALMFLLGSVAYAQATFTLDQAISTGINEIEARLATGAKVLVLNFSSPSQRFSDYVAEELTMGLVRNGKVSVIDRANLELIQREINYQQSGEISDNSARAIGRILGVQSIVSGSIEDLGSNYVFRFRTIALEDVEIQVITRVDVIKDNQTESLRAAGGTSSSTRTSAASGSPRTTRAASDSSFSISDSPKLALSAGTGLYFRPMLAHVYMKLGGESDWENLPTDLYFGAPVFLNAEFLKYFSVDLAGYYIRYMPKDDPGINFIAGTFSLYGQYPIQVNPKITIFPLLGIGYEMVFYGNSEGHSGTRKDFSSHYDYLYAKPGFGMNYSLTDNLRLNARFVWDIYLYNKDIAESIKQQKKVLDSVFYLQHGPSLFVGVSYVFLKM